MILRRFVRDTRGNFAMLLALAIVPVLGAVALAVDYTEMSRHRQATLNALDAANMATAWRLLSGESEGEVRRFAQDFFEANLGPVKPEDVVLSVELPDESAGGNTIKMSADLKYHPIFYGAFLKLMGREEAINIKLFAENEVRLKNTLEVALVLDNSGSMKDPGSGSGKQRLVLLKDAAKQLVDTMAAQGALMKQVEKPVQFAVVPFAASVNVGPGNANASWMDTQGRSSIHHENFDWSTMSPSLRVEKVGDVYRKTGTGWGADQNAIVSRFTLFNEMRRKYCTKKDSKGKCTVYAEAPLPGWAGCVEMRPYPYNVDNTTPNVSNPDTLFVPMFAPDETDTKSGTREAYNNWWPDSLTSGTAAVRQKYMPKYFTAAEKDPFDLYDDGPNLSCTTTPITPLADVTTGSGKTLIKGAIDSMVADGATNVTEGIAWGWRVVSGSEPFTQGRPDHERGNDKVIIVLTDGANTYYSPTTLAAPNGSAAADEAGNKSIYSNYGYAVRDRIFAGTKVAKKYDNDTYTKAMNDHMKQVCENAKAAGIVVMTVALDLSTKKSDEKAQIELLEECASESRIRRNQKLFWNTTGAGLSETFRQIADELSNLRFIG